jgi:hypothetical protein
LRTIEALGDAILPLLRDDACNLPKKIAGLTTQGPLRVGACFIGPTWPP